MLSSPFGLGDEEKKLGCGEYRKRVYWSTKPYTRTMSNSKSPFDFSGLSKLISSLTHNPYNEISSRSDLVETYTVKDAVNEMRADSLKRDTTATRQFWIIVFLTILSVAVAVYQAYLAYRPSIEERIIREMQQELRQQTATQNSVNQKIDSLAFKLQGDSSKITSKP